LAKREGRSKREIAERHFNQGRKQFFETLTKPGMKLLRQLESTLAAKRAMAICAVFDLVGRCIDLIGLC